MDRALPGTLEKMTRADLNSNASSPGDSTESRPRRYSVRDMNEPVLRLRCPYCQKKLRVREVYKGKTLHCPKCKDPFLVPDGTENDEGIALATLEGVVTRRTRDPRMVALLIVLDVFFFISLGYLIGRGWWG